MEGFYIFLGIMGIICVILSFMLSEKLEGRMNKSELDFSEEQLKLLLTSNQEALEEAVTMHAEKTKEAAMEETERALARLTNEKIMAVDEFSDTVLEKISQNHSEVIFLYNMLNEKERELKELVTASSQTTIHSMAGKEEKKQTATPSATKEPRGKKSSNRKNSQKQQNGKNENMIQLSEEEKRQEADTREEILKLYDSGLSITDIAQQLKIGQGEVKLIIDLYQGAR